MMKRGGQGRKPNTSRGDSAKRKPDGAQSPQTDWNSNFTDLSQYKLSETDQIKKKAERTSKNHIQAKQDWKTKIEKIETGEIKPKDLDLKPKLHHSAWKSNLK